MSTSVLFDAPGPRSRARHRIAGVVGGIVLVAFLVFALVALLGYSFLQASAKARIVNLATNLGALAVFIPQGAPMYRLGLCMAACNIVGGRLGAKAALKRGSGFVRVVFLTVVAALLVRLSYDIVTG